ncbi:type 1 fimbrial protein [Salmonella enterica]|nr:type 1 fimbrial protein [Salmonella enterica]
MKIKNRLFLLGAAMAVMSSSVFADTTGTQTFTANVTANTCVISGENIAHDLGDISKQALLSLGDWSALRVYDDAISVSGCPTTFNTVNIAMDYKALPDWGVYGWMDNSGTAKGVALKLIKGEGIGFAPGPNGYDYPLTSGGAVIPVTAQVARVAKSVVSDADVTSGTVNFTSTITISVK